MLKSFVLFSFIALVLGSCDPAVLNADYVTGGYCGDYATQGSCSDNQTPAGPRVTSTITVADDFVVDGPRGVELCDVSFLATIAGVPNCPDSVASSQLTVWRGVPRDECSEVVAVVNEGNVVFDDTYVQSDNSPIFNVHFPVDVELSPATYWFEVSFETLDFVESDVRVLFSSDAGNAICLMDNGDIIPFNYDLVFSTSSTVNEDFEFEAFSLAGVGEACGEMEVGSVSESNGVFHYVCVSGAEQVEFGRFTLQSGGLSAVDVEVVDYAHNARIGDDAAGFYTFVRGNVEESVWGKLPGENEFQISETLFEESASAAAVAFDKTTGNYLVSWAGQCQEETQSAVFLRCVNPTSGDMSSIVQLSDFRNYVSAEGRVSSSPSVAFNDVDKSFVASFIYRAPEGRHNVDEVFAHEVVCPADLSGEVHVGPLRQVSDHEPSNTPNKPFYKNIYAASVTHSGASNFNYFSFSGDGAFNEIFRINGQLTDNTLTRVGEEVQVSTFDAAKFPKVDVFQSSVAGSSTGTRMYVAQSILQNNTASGVVEVVSVVIDAETGEASAGNLYSIAASGEYVSLSQGYNGRYVLAVSSYDSTSLFALHLPGGDSLASPFGHGVAGQDLTEVFATLEFPDYPATDCSEPNNVVPRFAHPLYTRVIVQANGGTVGGTVHVTRTFRNSDESDYWSLPLTYDNGRFVTENFDASPSIHTRSEFRFTISVELENASGVFFADQEVSECRLTQMKTVNDRIPTRGSSE